MLKFVALILLLIIHAEKDEYPPVPLATISAGKWYRPRAEVTGKVLTVKTEADKDIHVKLGDDKGNWIIVEIIPELPLARPKVGTKITVKGIIRFDGEHKWWEAHPAVSWSLAKD